MNHGEIKMTYYINYEFQLKYAKTVQAKLSLCKELEKEYNEDLRAYRDDKSFCDGLRNDYQEMVEIIKKKCKRCRKETKFAIDTIFDGL